MKQKASKLLSFRITLPQVSNWRSEGFESSGLTNTGCHICRCESALFLFRGEVVHKLQIQDDKVDFNPFLITG
jgi:hypothetical protein